MLSSTLKAENKAPCWNNMPTRLAAPRTPSWAAGRPSTFTLPRLGVSSPRILRSSTVLPLPEPPTNDNSSPVWMLRFRSLCTTDSTPAVTKVDHRPWMSTTGLFAPVIGVESVGSFLGASAIAFVGAFICPHPGTPVQTPS